MTYLTAEQVAAKLGWHIKTVYRNTILPRVKLGGSVFWIEEQIDALMTMSAKPKPAPEPKKTVMRQRLKVAERKR